MLINALELSLYGFILSVGFTLTTGPEEIFSFIRLPFKRVRFMQRLMGCGKCLSGWFTIAVALPYLVINNNFSGYLITGITFILAVCLALLFGKLFDKYIL